MPIDSKHPGYDVTESKLTIDAVMGDVKSYVPRLTAQNETEFKAYVDRGVYYNAVERTREAMVGTMLRKPYVTDYAVEDVKISGGMNFDEFLSETISSLLTEGRVGMLVDYSETHETPIIVSYGNSEIINWSVVDDVVQFIVLAESRLVPDEDDQYEFKNEVVYRELFLEDDLYAVRIWVSDGSNTFKPLPTIYPTIRNERLTEIPFVFLNTHATTPMVHKPVLNGIAEINISHFKTTTDLEHAAHYTALPQPVLMGDTAEETGTLAIGTYSVWQLQVDAKVEYLEFNGAGIGKLQEILKAKESNMAALGAAMLQDRGGVESAEALRIRSGADSSALVRISYVVSSAVAQVLTLDARWKSMDIDVEFELSKDFTAGRLSAQELKALMDLYITGSISKEAFLQNLHDGEIINDIDAEKGEVVNEPTNSPVIP